jgi:hypothetical protein
MLILIAGNWVNGWWENRSDTLEERFMNAMDVFLEGCAAPQAAKSQPPRSGRKAASRHGP